MAEPEKKAPEAATPVDETAPSIKSAFEQNPGLPEQMDAPWWKELPPAGEFATLEGAAAVEPATEFRVAHDASMLAFYIRCDVQLSQRLFECSAPKQTAFSNSTIALDRRSFAPQFFDERVLQPASGVE